MPSIMLGVNQTVMMVLAMVIIAGLVGGGALGFEAVSGLAKSELGRGIEAGLAIVILAIVLDRITQAWAKGSGQRYARSTCFGRKARWRMATCRTETMSGN